MNFRQEKPLESPPKKNLPNFDQYGFLTVYLNIQIAFRNATKIKI